MRILHVFPDDGPTWSKHWHYYDGRCVLILCSWSAVFSYFRFTCLFLLCDAWCICEGTKTEV